MLGPLLPPSSAGVDVGRARDRSDGPLLALLAMASLRIRSAREPDPGDVAGRTGGVGCPPLSSEPRSRVLRRHLGTSAVRTGDRPPAGYRLRLEPGESRRPAKRTALLDRARQCCFRRCLPPAWTSCADARSAWAGPQCSRNSPTSSRCCTGFDNRWRNSDWPPLTSTPQAGVGDRRLPGSVSKVRRQLSSTEERPLSRVERPAQHASAPAGSGRAAEALRAGHASTASGWPRAGGPYKPSAACLSALEQINRRR